MQANLVLQLLGVLVVLKVEQSGHAQFVQAKLLLERAQVAGDAFAGVVSGWVEPTATGITDLFVEYPPFADPVFQLREHVVIDRNTRL
ncbi:hypothetical protein ALQ93_200204 [Pseudomonas syringae pv. pisi]|nr:hypothetical protein ALQ93_200204 [Pseudomonas syringae pv. pisi]